MNTNPITTTELPWNVSTLAGTLDVSAELLRPPPRRAGRMSCSLTIDAVRARTKTVTRRHVDTWRKLQPGDHLTLIEKGMGLPKGARQVVLDVVELVDVRVESLSAVTDDEVLREGFGEHRYTVRDFQVLWLGSHGYHAATDPTGVLVRRIEWRYLP
jgi:hypothetical protein